MIIYEGPSALDGEPIVAIATGLERKSRNAKTGNLIQVWILRADKPPLEAVRSGADASVCGDCKHRGTSCYVNIGQAPQSVWRTYAAGRYARAADLEAVSAALAGKDVRMSAYGDPAALPGEVVKACLDKASGHTGYTHQWRRAPELAYWLMASADTPAERIQAKMLGFRTFRVRHVSATLLPQELECLADSKGLTCEACKLCSGQSRPGKRDISIQVHGARKSSFATAG